MKIVATTPEVPHVSLQAAETAFDETGVKRELAGFAAMVVAGASPGTTLRWHCSLSRWHCTTGHSKPT